VSKIKIIHREDLLLYCPFQGGSGCLVSPDSQECPVESDDGSIEVPLPGLCPLQSWGSVTVALVVGSDIIEGRH